MTATAEDLGNALIRGTSNALLGEITLNLLAAWAEDRRAIERTIGSVTADVAEVDHLRLMEFAGLNLTCGQANAMERLTGYAMGEIISADEGYVRQGLRDDLAKRCQALPSPDEVSTATVEVTAHVGQAFGALITTLSRLAESDDLDVLWQLSDVIDAITSTIARAFGVES